MTLLQKLFGKWEIIEKRKGVGIYGSILCDDWEEQGVYILERNSKTGKERAYFETLSGEKTPVSIYVFE